MINSYRDAYNDTIEDKQRRTFAGMLTCADDGIGNVTRVLNETGILDDAIGWPFLSFLLFSLIYFFVVIITTDNGGPTTTNDGIGSRNWPLRGGKHRFVHVCNICCFILLRFGIFSIWEGGTRGIGIIWSKKFLPQAKNNTYFNLIHAADWMPTLLNAAGIERPKVINIF